MPEAADRVFGLGVEFSDVDFSEITSEFQGITQAMQRAGSFIFSWKGAAVAGLAAVGIAAVRAGQQAVAAAAQVDAAFREVATLLPTVSERMDAVKNQVVSLSTDVPEPPAQLTGALYQAISAGARDTQEALRLVEVSSKAAVAGLTETETAVDTITSVLNAYQLEATEAARVSDILFTTVEQGKVRFEELSASIGDAVTSAAQVGVSIEELGAAIATMTKFGVSAQKSTTALNRLFLEATTQSTKQKEALNKLGVEFSASRIKQEGFIEVLKDLREATGGSIDQLSNAIPSIRSARAAFVLAGDGASEFERVLGEMQRSAGTTQDAFSDMNRMLENQRQLVSNELNQTFVELGENILPTVHDALRLVLDLFESDMDEAIRRAKELGDTFEAMTLRREQQIKELRNQLDALDEDIESAVEGITGQFLPAGTPMPEDFDMGQIADEITRSKEEMQDLNFLTISILQHFVDIGQEAGQELAEGPLQALADQEGAVQVFLDNVNQLRDNWRDMSDQELSEVVSQIESGAEHLQSQEDLSEDVKNDFREIRGLTSQIAQIISERIQTRAKIAQFASEAVRREERELAALKERRRTLSLNREENEELLDDINERIDRQKTEIRIAEQTARIDALRQSALIENVETISEAKNLRQDIAQRLEDSQAPLSELVKMSEEELANQKGITEAEAAKFRLVSDLVLAMERRQQLRDSLEESAENELTTLQKIQRRLNRINRIELESESNLRERLQIWEQLVGINNQIETLREDEAANQMKLNDLYREREQALGRLRMLRQERTQDAKDFGSLVEEVTREVTESGVVVPTLEFDSEALQDDVESRLERIQAEVGLEAQLMPGVLESEFGVAEDSAEALSEDLLKNAEVIERIRQLEFQKELFEMAGAEDRAQDAAEKLAEIKENKLEPILENMIDKYGKNSDEVEALRDIMDEMGLTAEDTDSGLEDMFDSISDGINGVLQLADALGVLDDSTRKVLQGMQGLASAAGNIAGGNIVGGIAQGIGSIANIASGLFGGGKSDREKLIRENNIRLAELRNSLEEQIDVLTSFTGEELGEFRTFLSSLQGVDDASDLTAAQMAKLERASSALGITLDKENIDESIRAMNAALREVEIEDFFETFEGKMDALQRRMELFDIENPIKEVRRMREIFLEFVDLPARLEQQLRATDVTTAEGRQDMTELLQQLFEMLESGDLGEEALGGLTIEEFMDQLSEQEQALDEIAEQEGESQDFGVDRTITEITGSKLVSIGTTQVFWLERIALHTEQIFAALNGGVQPPTEEDMKKSGLAERPGGELNFDIEVNVFGASGSGEEAIEDALIDELLPILSKKIRDQIRREERRQGR